MTAVERAAEIYRDVLQARLGLDVTMTAHSVRCEPIPGFPVAVLLYPSDPEYMRLITSWSPDESSIQISRDKKLNIADEATGEIKGAMATLDEDDDFRMSVEMLVAGTNLLPTPEHIQSIMPRAMSMLIDCARHIMTACEFHDITDAVEQEISPEDGTADEQN